MAIKPTLSSPFPLCFPTAKRRQAAALHRRSSLLPPRPLANSGCSGEPLPLSLALCASPCRRESPGINLACSRALQVLLRSSPTSPSRCCHFGDRFRQGHDSPRPPVHSSSFAVSSCASGEQPRIQNPPIALVCLCTAVLRRAPVSLTPVDPESTPLSRWILIQGLDLALDHALSACQFGANVHQSDRATWLVQVSRGQFQSNPNSNSI